MTAEWQLLCPQRIKVLWLPFQNKLLANRIRVHRHIAIDARFVACGDPIESIDHILFTYDWTGCTRALTIVHWIKLNISWLKVNTEGARNEQFECAVVESVVQNHDGVWIAGCARNIGACSVLEISKDQILTN
ncbi:hypothetical protein Gotri_027302 [Gossypium trilobum]|uniref:Reverse transcriptase zinc-binding domain-containing protein n=1 Tax=Gossypium trilobum TaxID=34281 RepID=A0A7J9FQI1_9ROSI|nr:hypothetical protein [Gossypium trilobum]